jgi:hypothetical protein
MGLKSQVTLTDYPPIGLMLCHHIPVVTISTAGGKMASMKPESSHQEIACQQVLIEDSSVFSVQWTVLSVSIAGTLSPLYVMQRYLAYIRTCTLSLIRPVELETGIEFRLLASSWSLINFYPPLVTTDSSTLCICGGLLVQPRQCDRGEFRFSVDRVPDGVRVALQLSEFCPLILGSSSPSLIRFWLYRLTQAAIHQLVTVRFLKLLYRELTGSSAAVKLVKVAIRVGRPV